MTPRQAIRWSYLVGLAFFLGSIWWLVHVTVVGLIVLCAYLALYFGLFGVIVSRTSTVHRPPSTVPLFVIPSSWVALEYLRSHLLSGFGWNVLGYSQTPSLSAIQIADVTGVWGVSFVMVAMNVAIAQYLSERDVRKALPVMILAVGCVVATWRYGQARLAQPEAGGWVKVAVVQGNIPQEEKWDEAFQQAILERYERLTREAATHSPQLIMWPETAVPGYLGFDQAMTQRVQQLAVFVQTPLLVGAPMGKPIDGTVHLTNSAALLDTMGAIASRYDKLHLVPFGEFIPFESVFPWLRKLLPPIGDFVPGHDHTVFQSAIRNPQSAIPDAKALPFSVLICFEDIFPHLARQFVRRGARFLVTITNDAWFGNTAAAYQHAQASTLRAVELRVPMVRAANTGWSGCIDAKGRWIASVRDPRGQALFVEGVAVCEVAVASNSDSVYRRYGDWFAWLCLLGCLGWAIFAIIPRR
jgi:apolipoprotein N-acyltransferase